MTVQFSLLVQNVEWVVHEKDAFLHHINVLHSVIRGIGRREEIRILLYY